MKRALFGLAALVSLAVALPAAAADSVAVKTFESLCMKVEGDGTSALSVADAAGWAKIPDAFMKSIGGSGSMSLSKGGARAMVIDRTLIMLLAGRGVMGRTEADLCAVMTFASEGDQARKDMGQLIGAAPMQDGMPDMKGVSIWAYVEGPKGREYITDLNSRKAMKAMADGKLMMVMAGDQSGMTIVMQMRPDMPE